MCSSARGSGVVPTTVPLIEIHRYGSAATRTATRGSRCRFLAFTRPSAVLISRSSPSASIQVIDACAVPSSLIVTRVAYVVFPLTSSTSSGVSSAVMRRLRLRLGDDGQAELGELLG